MTFETGTDEIALENLQASKARLRGDRELPTLQELKDDLLHSDEGIQRVEIMIAVNSYNEGVVDTLKRLIARGFLQVKE